MRSWHVIIAVGSLSVMLAAGFAAGKVKIHPLGDSTTEWGPADQCYRYHLWVKLAASPLTDVDFVGSLSGPAEGGAWDRDHDGHTGSRADQVLNGGLAYNHAGSIKAWAPLYRPDIALIHLGTNDLRGGETPQQVARDIEGIILVYRQAVPTAAILVAQIIPATANWFAAASHQGLNREIAALAARLNTTASPVVAVNLTAGYDAATDNRDGLHPGATGARKMADGFYSAIVAILTRTASTGGTGSLAAPNAAPRLPRLAGLTTQSGGHDLMGRFRGWNSRVPTAILFPATGISIVTER